MSKLIIYAKKDEDINVLIELAKVKYPSMDSYDCYVDGYRDYIAYSKMKKRLIPGKSKVLIPSLNNIGLSNRDVYKELVWFKDNNIALIIADYPATINFENAEVNKLAIGILVDVYRSLRDIKTNDIRRQVTTVGRKKINFPDGWEELYSQWEKGTISAKEFMDKTGLKKGTFYHLINDYKEILAMNKDSFSVG